MTKETTELHNVESMSYTENGVRAGFVYGSFMQKNKFVFETPVYRLELYTESNENSLDIWGRETMVYPKEPGRIERR